MKVGDLVRVSADGDYYDTRWAGALAIVAGTKDREGYVLLKRISDGKLGEIVSYRVELPEEQTDEGR